MPGQPTPVVEMRNIEKRFGNIQALAGVHLELRENEIHGLVGDNGSGKSTLIKILVGLHKANNGEIRIRGDRVEFDNPKQARDYGISTVYQDLALAPDLSVAENIYLGRYPKKRVGPIPIVDYGTMKETARDVLRDRLNIDIDTTSKVENLSGGERQAVAIARALIVDPDIIIMDEPMSSLSADSVKRVKQLVRNLRDEGVTVLLISHNLQEVFDLTNTLTILDNGHYVGRVETDSISEDDVVRMMVGGKVPEDIEEQVHTTPSFDSVAGD